MPAFEDINDLIKFAVNSTNLARMATFPATALDNVSEP